MTVIFRNPAICIVHSLTQTAFVDVKFKPACSLYIFGLKDRFDAWKRALSLYKKVKDEGEEVLNIAVDEINKFTDLIVTYRAYRRDMYRRETRGIKSIIFRICRKNQEEMEAVKSRIGEAYEEYEEKMRKRNEKLLKDESVAIDDDADWKNIENAFSQLAAVYEYPKKEELYTPQIDHKKPSEDYRAMIHGTDADDEEYFELDTDVELPF